MISEQVRALPPLQIFLYPSEQNSVISNKPVTPPFNQLYGTFALPYTAASCYQHAYTEYIHEYAVTIRLRSEFFLQIRHYAFYSFRTRQIGFKQRNADMPCGIQQLYGGEMKIFGYKETADVLFTQLMYGVEPLGRFECPEIGHFGISQNLNPTAMDMISKSSEGESRFLYSMTINVPVF